MHLIYFPFINLPKVAEPFILISCVSMFILFALQVSKNMLTLKLPNFCRHCIFHYCIESIYTNSK